MRTSIILLFAVVFTLVLNGQQRKAIDPVISAMHTISSHDLLEWVVIQCDDKYAGRLTGTPEYQACSITTDPSLTPTMPGIRILFMFM